MNYVSTALWLLVIGVSFGLGWGSFGLLVLGVAGPALLVLWGLVRH